MAAAVHTSRCVCCEKKFSGRRVNSLTLSLSNLSWVLPCLCVHSKIFLAVVHIPILYLLLFQPHRFVDIRQDNTGNLYKAVPRLREWCRQVEAEELGTWEPGNSPIEIPCKEQLGNSWFISLRCFDWLLHLLSLHFLYDTLPIMFTLKKVDYCDVLHAPPLQEICFLGPLRTRGWTG